MSNFIFQYDSLNKTHLFLSVSSGKTLYKITRYGGNYKLDPISTSYPILALSNFSTLESAKDYLTRNYSNREE